ncbi:MAG: hypothetical protein WCY53_00625 [Sphaerochaetaceae bacterium]|jgi:hypothetical protein
MSSGFWIPMVAIVTPFLFAGWVIKLSINAKEKKERLKEDTLDNHISVSEIEQLAKRIENLEIIIKSRENDRK